jgi:hypothetical protein
MPRHEVGQLGGIGRLGDGGQRVLGDVLLDLGVFLELLGHGPGQRGDGVGVALFLGQFGRGRLEELVVLDELLDDHAGAALDQHLHRAVGQLQKLQHVGQHAVAVDAVMGRVVHGRVELARQQDLLVVLHHLFERADGFLAAHEERHDHVGKHHDVAQRQYGIGFGALGHIAFLDVLAGGLGPRSRGSRLGLPSGYSDLVRLCSGFNRRLPRRAHVGTLCPPRAAGTMGNRPEAAARARLPTGFWPNPRAV